MKKYLIVVDMQTDFVDGALGTKEAQAIVPHVVEKVRNYPGTVIFTQDTHFEDYMDTQEGHNLPVPHCIKGTAGWQIIPELQEFVKDARVFEKNTFAAPLAMSQWLMEDAGDDDYTIELIGLCTDICVVSNALTIKGIMPEVPMSVDASCCAGVTPEKHEAALETMRSCQINVF